MADGGGNQFDVEAEFPNWYGTLELNDAESKHPLRLKGIAAFVSAAKQADVEALIRLVWNSKQTPDAEVIVRLRKALYEADNAFQMSGNEKEIHLLAGAALAVMMCDGPMEHLTPLMTSGADFLGQRSQKLPINLLSIAEAAIRSQAAENRRPELTKALSTDVPKAVLTTVTGKLNEGMTSEVLNAAFGLANDAMRVPVAQLAVRYSTWFGAVQRYIQVQDEELEILWWLVGRYSEDRQADFDEIAKLEKPLVLAKELASRTVFYPGPPSIKGLLARAGVDPKDEATVPELINAVSDAWVNALNFKGEPSPVTMPMHFALKKRQETSVGNAWIEFWANATGISATQKFPVIMLGISFFREVLLNKWA